MNEKQHKRMNELFDQVKDKHDWKNPIEFVVPQGTTAKQIQEYLDAITYCTGNSGHEMAVTTTDGVTTIRAIGYRMGSCGDY